jgi:site-specific DNA recombinase
MNQRQVIELIRVSTEGQASEDRAGIPAQRAINRRTAAAYGLQIVRTIELTDVSGANVLRTPEIQEMLSLMVSPEIHGVVTKEFSRLMRPDNFADFVLLQSFIDTKTILYLPEGPLDLGAKSGLLMGAVRAAMAGMERKEILERMQEGKEAIRRAGKHPGGPSQLPFGVGYSREGGWFYTPEAEKIRQAYNLVLTTGKPYSQIAEELNLPRTSLRFILQNPIYAGRRVYTEKRDQSMAGYVARPGGRQGYRKKIKRNADEIISVQVMEGLISEDVFTQVQGVLSARAARERAVRMKNAPLFLFNGFLACGLCGEPMYSHTNQRAGYYYCRRNSTRERQRRQESACSNPYIIASKIEAKIETLLAEKMQNRDFLEHIADTYFRHVAEAQALEADTKAIERQIEALMVKRNRVLESYFDGVIDRQARDERIKAIDADLSVYRAIEAPKAHAKELGLQGLSELLSVFAEIPYLSREDKRILMRGCNTRIYLEGYTIKGLEMAGIPGNSSYSDGLSRTAP